MAHCLVRSRPRALTRASLAVALGPAGRDLIAGATTDWDLRTVAVTRYPPALAAALRKAETVPGRGTELWFAPATAPSPEERAEALADL